MAAVHKQILSKPFSEIYLVNKPETKASINGRSIVAASIAGSYAKVTGCVATQKVGMLSNVIYIDTIENTRVDNTELTGMCDVSEIYEKIDEIDRQSATDYFNKKGVAITEQGIENYINNVLTIANKNKDSSYNNTSIVVLHKNFEKLSLQSFLGCNIDQLKNEYRNCPSDQYFFIPLTLYPITPLKVSAPPHANGIFISKAKGTVFRIEPQYYTQEMQKTSLNFELTQKKINDSIIKLVNNIGLKDPKLIEISVTCPQAIVEDGNCIFWSFLIFEEIINNLYKKDINIVIKEISSKSKQELEDLIYNYKKKLYFTILPTYLKKMGWVWPEYETKKDIIKQEIEEEYATEVQRSRGLPVPKIGPAPKLGGKTRRHKKLKKTKKSKNQRAR